MKSFPFLARIDYEMDTTGIIEQITNVQKACRDLDEEVRKLNDLISPNEINIKVSNEE